MKYQAMRREVLEACRVLADQGFLAGTGGNLALRVDENVFAVTPSATDYYTMSTADICIVGLDDQRHLEGDRKPSVECGLHARLLAARRDCHASIHTHQPVASAYTLLARPLTPSLAEHGDLLGKIIPCAGYAPSGTSWLAGQVARCVRPDVHALLMRNHGVVCLGADISLAMRRVAALEHACAIYFEQQLNEQKHRLPVGLITAVEEVLGRLTHCDKLGAAT